MVNLTFLAGGYDVFVATYLFNTVTSTLSVTGRSPTGDGPSWISLHPANKSVLYAVNEIEDGTIQSFTINSDGMLSSVVDSVSSGGGSPAFVVALPSGAAGSGTDVAVMNYVGGNGRIIPTASELKFDDNAPSASVITFPRKPGTGDQLADSHPHMAVQYRGEVLIPDLGGDTIWRLARQNNAWNIVGQVLQPVGSGPRHIAVYGDRLFTLHELASTLTVQALPLPPVSSNITKVPFISSVSIIPPDPPAGSAWGAAEILIPAPNAKFPAVPIFGSANSATPYIYVSNRNIGTPDPEDPKTQLGDSIAIYELLGKGTASERLSLVNHVYTGLSQVRGMEFSDLVTVNEAGIANEKEQYLVAAGVAGTGGVAVLKRTERGRNLEVVARNVDIETRTSFVWL